MNIDFDWLKNELRLQNMSKEECDALERVIEPMFVLPGIPIIHQGAAGSNLYLLRSGSVRITRMLHERETELSSGDYSRVFGELSMFSDEPVSANVIADQECVVYKISCENFQQLMREQSSLALKMLTFIVRNMAQVIRHLDGKKGASRH